MADVDLVPVNNELQKLKKEQLVEIIINGKFTNSVKNVNSEVIQNFLEKNWMKRSDCAVNTKVNLTNKNTVSSNIDEKSYQTEVLNKLIYQLEKRVDDQEFIINLLKNSSERNVLNHNICSETSLGLEHDHTTNKAENYSINASLTAQVPSSVPPPLTQKSNQRQSTTTTATTSTAKSSYANKTKNQHSTQGRNSQTSLAQKHFNVNAAEVNIPHSLLAQPKQSQMQQIDRQPRRQFNSAITGSSTENKQIIRTVPQHGHLRVFRLHPDTDQKELENFLKLTAPQIPFLVSPLSKNEAEASFKLSFPLEFKEEVYNPDIWPKGAAVNRFNMNRRNFRNMKYHRNPQ